VGRVPAKEKSAIGVAIAEFSEKLNECAEAAGTNPK
jgi:hypothetical protein